MINRIKSIYRAALERPLYEKILFLICVLSIIGAMIYYVCAVPYIGNSETYMSLLYAKESIRAGELIPTGFMYRNEINYIPLNILFIIPALFTDNVAVCNTFVEAVMVFAGSAAVIYCSRKVSKNNCWLIYIPILWCGFCVGYVKFMFRLAGYLFLVLFTFLIYALISDSLDEKLAVKSWAKFLISAFLIMIITFSGLRLIQMYTIPIAGALVIYFIIEHLGDNGIAQTVKSKGFVKLLIAAGIILGASAIGYLTSRVMIHQNVLPFVTSGQSEFFLKTDIGENLHKLLQYFMQISGVQDTSALFSYNGIVGFIKIAFNILMLIVFPILALANYKNESTPMKLFLLISLIHVAEIILLSIFSNALSEERYIYSSVMLLYYVSSHYVYEHIFKSEKKFGIKALISVCAVAAFALPGAVALASSAADYEDNVNGAHIVTDFLKSKGLTYGYGTYWNSDNFTAYSDFEVRVCKVGVGSSVTLHRNGTLSILHDYTEDAHQGTTFLLLEGGENDTFLASDSYMKFGEPQEICKISKYTVYIYDYNIANNNFGGEFGGFTGSELEKINAACRENNIDIAFGVENGIITSILRGNTNNIDDISADAAIMAVTRDNIAEPAQKLNTAVGEYNLYTCKMSEFDYAPNGNLVAGSGFESEADLDNWSVGSGETVSCSDGALTITCTKESDRRFNQSITISEEQVGKPMTLSFKVNKVTGEPVCRVWGEDFNENRYFTEYVTEPGVYCFTFTPTSTKLTIQPIVPATLKSSAEIEWVKLESGNIFTGYIPAQINANLADGSDFADESDLELWAVGGGETVSCEDGALKITCTKENDRRFNQAITIDKELVGEPMTLSFEISDIDGYVLTRIWGEDFKEDRYITETITEAGVYSFTFVPTSEELTIQPVLPEKLNNGATVEWIKLEQGSAATEYVPFAA